MDRHGVERMLIGGAAPEESPALAEASSISEGRLMPVAAIDPRRPDATDDLDRLLQEGFAGLQLFPGVDGLALAGDEVRAVLDVAARNSALVIVHCGLISTRLADAVGLERRIDLRAADPLAIIPLADEYPALPFVVPAFGGGFFRETLMAGRQCENVHVDTSTDQSWISTQGRPKTLGDVFERTLEVFGPERILFATGSGSFPAGWRHERRTEQREAAGACGLGPDDMARIFAGNAERLLRRDPPGLAGPRASEPILVCG